VQQHRGVGFLHCGALSVWWCLPLRSFSVAVFTSVVFSILVWEGGAAVLLCFSIVVEC
jgi:hypothetical protein